MAADDISAGRPYPRGELPVVGHDHDRVIGRFDLEDDLIIGGDACIAEPDDHLSEARATSVSAGATAVEHHRRSDAPGTCEVGHRTDQPGPLLFQVERSMPLERDVVAVDEHTPTAMQVQIHRLPGARVHAGRQFARPPRHESRRSGIAIGRSGRAPFGRRAPGGPGSLPVDPTTITRTAPLLVATQLSQLFTHRGDIVRTTPTFPLDRSLALPVRNLHLAVESSDLALEGAHSFLRRHQLLLQVTDLPFGEIGTSSRVVTLASGLLESRAVPA